MIDVLDAQDRDSPYEVRRAKTPIDMPDDDDPEREAKLRQWINDRLVKHNGDVLIFGSVEPNARRLRLKFGTFSDASRPTTYEMSEFFDLPQAFTQDLTDAIVGHAVSLCATGPEDAGQFIADRMVEVADRLSRVLAQPMPGLTDADKARLYDGLRTAAYHVGHERGETEYWQMALKAGEAALDLTPQDKDSPDRLDRMRALSGICRSIGVRSEGTEMLDRGVDLAESVYEIRKEVGSPSQRAGATEDLGNAIQARADRSGRQEEMQRAADLFSEALAVFTVEKFPGDHARQQYNLGGVLEWLGHRAGDLGQLEQAVAARKTAVDLTDRDRRPAVWAAFQNGYAGSLLDLGQIGESSETVLKAIEAYEPLHEIWTRETVPTGWAGVHCNNAHAASVVGELSSRTECLVDAIHHYNTALHVLSPDAHLEFWTNTKQGLAATLIRLAQHQDGDPERTGSILDA